MQGAPLAIIKIGRLPQRSRKTMATMVNKKFTVPIITFVIGAMLVDCPGKCSLTMIEQ
jgi:hypothetical protein